MKNFDFYLYCKENDYDIKWSYFNNNFVRTWFTVLETAQVRANLSTAQILISHSLLQPRTLRRWATIMQRPPAPPRPPLTPPSPPSPLPLIHLFIPCRNNSMPSERDVVRTWGKIRHRVFYVYLRVIFTNPRLNTFGILLFFWWNGSVVLTAIFPSRFYINFISSYMRGLFYLILAVFDCSSLPLLIPWNLD